MSWSTEARVQSDSQTLGGLAKERAIALLDVGFSGVIRICYQSIRYVMLSLAVCCYKNLPCFLFASFMWLDRYGWQLNYTSNIHFCSQIRIERDEQYFLSNHTVCHYFFVDKYFCSTGSLFFSSAFPYSFIIFLRRFIKMKL